MSKKQVPVVLKVDNTIQLLNNWGHPGLYRAHIHQAPQLILWAKMSFPFEGYSGVSSESGHDEMQGNKVLKKNKIDLFIFSISSWFSFLLISLVLSNHSLDNRLARAHKPGTSKFGFDDQIWRSLFCRLSRMFLLVLLFCFDPFSSATQGNLESWLSFDDVFAKSRSGERCLCTTGPKIRRC